MHTVNVVKPYNASGLEVTHPADTAVDIEEGTEPTRCPRWNGMVARQNKDQECERTCQKKAAREKGSVR